MKFKHSQNFKCENITIKYSAIQNIPCWISEQFASLSSLKVQINIQYLGLAL